jgi:hypothetical protein
MSCYCLIAQNIQHEWVSTVGSSNSRANGNSLVIDSNKAVIVAGQFENTMDFDPGLGVLNLSSNGLDDIFIAKYDTAGSLLWAKNIGSPSWDQVEEIKIDSKGNLILLCLVQGFADLDPGPGYFYVDPIGSASVIKLDNLGNLIWVKMIPTRVETMDIDASDNIIVSGDFIGTYDFDPGLGTHSVSSNTNGPGTDLYILKLNDTGDFVWMILRIVFIWQATLLNQWILTLVQVTITFLQLDQIMMTHLWLNWIV